MAVKKNKEEIEELAIDVDNPIDEQGENKEQQPAMPAAPQTQAPARPQSAQQVAPQSESETDTDLLLHIARHAELRAKAIQQILKWAISSTTSADWTDYNGVPYLTATGAEKIARICRISWEIDPNPVVETYPDGHFTYIYHGRFWLEGGSVITVEGSRSSLDPFYSKRGGVMIPPEKIDRNAVRKGAYTNCINNGIKRLLGLRNISWETLEEFGIKPQSQVRYKTSSTTANKKSATTSTTSASKKKDEDIPKIEQLRMKIRQLAQTMQTHGIYDQFKEIVGGGVDKVSDIKDEDEAKKIITELVNAINRKIDEEIASKEGGQ